MLFAAVLIAAVPAWVPARWHSSEPATLDLVAMTPVNCLLLEREAWSEPFNRAAASRGIATLAVLRAPGRDAVEAARRATALGFTGVVLEGDFDSSIPRVLADSRITTVELPSREHIRLADPSLQVAGTFQGVWPGVQIQQDGATKSAPSGAPWIDTNTGFLRFARAYTSAPVWIANTPPPDTVVTAQRYMQVIADAEISGARWVIALDNSFEKRLLARDAKTIAEWRRMGSLLRFYESHGEWRDMPPRAALAVVEDVDSGALLAGGVLDMIAVKHTPVRPVPSAKLTPAAMSGTRMAVDVDPSSLTAAQKDVLKGFTRSGGTLLSGPPQWKFPAPRPGEITLSAEDFKKLDEIWKEVNSMTGRGNLGARLFNVSSMLSNLLQSADGKRVLLHLVNYTEFPVDSVTAHVLGTYKRATLLAPEAQPRNVPVYAVEEGTGIDIDKVEVAATLILEAE